MLAKDLIRPSAVVLGIAAAAALGFAAGYAAGRNPAFLRRALRSLAGGWERLSGALAETREEIGDLWADASEGARQTVEDEALQQAATAAAAAVEAASRASKTAPDPTASRNAVSASLKSAKPKPRPRKAGGA